MSILLAQNPRPLKAALLLGGALTALLIHAPAQAQTWQGGDNQWSNPSNWSGGAVPGSLPFTFITGPVATPVIDAETAATNILFVGSLGTADLTIRNGGLLTSSSVVVGNSTNNAALPGIANETGTVTVTGDGSKWTADSITLGLYGHGVLNVVAGGEVVSDQTVALGATALSQGTLNVSGADSRFEVTSHGLLIGADGKGVFTLSDGAKAYSTSGALGVNATARGEATIEGLGTLWQITGSSLNVGGRGSGALVVKDGARIDVIGAANRFTLANYVGSVGTASITGGAAVTVDYQSYIGDGGSGSLTLASGGQLKATTIALGVQSTAEGTLVLDGAGTSAHATSSLHIGYLGKGEATVSNGATLRADNAVNGITLGFEAGSKGTLNIGSAAGEAATGAGIVASPWIRFRNGEGRLVLNHNTANYVLASQLISAGSDVGAVDILAGDTTFSGDSSGFTGVTSIIGGALRLTGALNGTVRVFEQGTLQVGNGVVDGQLLADVVNDGVVIFDQSGDYDYTGALSGGGGLIKRGAGTLLLSGDYSYTGTTTVDGGSVKLTSQLNAQTDLEINNGVFDLSDRTQQVSGLSGAGGFLELGDDGDLTVVQTQNAVFGGGLRGDGVFTKAGAGALNLTGTSSFTGLVNVNAGRLALNGVLPGQISVNSGGVLGGVGTAGRILVRNGGTLAPGNSIGTLRVNTGVVFEAGSIYAVEVNAAGQSDRLDAAGQALLQGGTVQVLAESGNYGPQTRYVILSAAGGVQGQFAGVTSNFAYLDPRLIYSANQVELALTRNDVALPDVAQTRNQRATGAAIADAFTNTSDVYFNLVGLSADGARKAFDSLSGEAHPSSLSAAVQHGDNLRRNLIERLDLPAAEGTTIWAEGIGERTELDAASGAAGVDGRNAAGFRMGLETQVGGVRLGLAAGYGDAELEIRDRSSRADLEMIHLAAYAGARAGVFNLRGGITYSDLDFSTRRTAQVGALSQELTAEYGGQSWQAFGEAGYDVVIDGATVEPFIGFNGLWLGNDAFQERGGDMALAGADQTRERVWSTVGVKTRHHFEMGAPVTLNVKAGWQHALSERTVESDLAFADGEAFTIHGAPLAKDAALVDVRLEWRLSERMALGLGYNGTFADQGQAQAARVMFSSQF